MSVLIDVIILAVVVVLHWRLARSLLAYVRRFFLALVYGVLGAGFVLGFHDVSARVPLPWWVIERYAGAASLVVFGSAGLWFVCELYQAVSRGMGDRAPDPSRRRLLQATGSALLASPVAVLGYGALVMRTDFRVREIDLPLPGLPRDLEGLRLLLLSDIHLSVFLSEAEFARVIDASNELRPHAAFVTGDLITGRGDPLDACLRQIARLRTDAGVLGCLGNHEIYARAEDYAAQEAARLGVGLLRGDARRLRFGSTVVNVAGVDYQPTTRKRDYLEGAERLVQPGALNILLSHNPDVFPVAARKGYDVTLAGHTHGGQVTVEILDQSISPARFITPFVYGLYREGPRAAYVTRGVGTVGIPARIGAPPEIALIRLRRA